jgi:drug/metabolite transporter (DMT)-like permease
MSRLQADLLLLLVALIWGAAFVAQKDALAHVGTFTFVASRFSLSALLVLPLAWREHKRASGATSMNKASRRDLALLCASFAGAVIFQQAGLESTSVTNAGFLTGLYVLFVLIICRIFYKQKLSPLIYPSALMSIAGVFLLSGGKLSAISSGDGLVLLCAVGFGIQVSLIGKIMSDVKAPFRICFVQYVVTAIVALVCAMLFEHPDMENIIKAGIPILYAGAISGGIAYTLQVVAQQYTPASDSAVILSGESVFAALTAALMNGERLSLMGFSGCALIIFAILLVEFGPYVVARKQT